MKKIDEIIGDSKPVGIAGHVRPDGDCVGSCMALYNYLKKTDRIYRLKFIWNMSTANLILLRVLKK